MRAAPSALDGGNTQQYLDQTTAFFYCVPLFARCQDTSARSQVELSAVYARAHRPEKSARRRRPSARALLMSLPLAVLLLLPR